MSFAEKLRIARERRNMTQQHVADAMQIDKSTYCGYETGKRQPDVPKLKQLSKILGVSGDELLETGFEKTPTVSGERQVTDDDVKFALFGGKGDITDAMYEEVKFFASFVKQRENEKKRGE